MEDRKAWFFLMFSRRSSSYADSPPTFCYTQTPNWHHSYSLQAFKHRITSTITSDINVESLVYLQLSGPIHLHPFSSSLAFCFCFLLSIERKCGPITEQISNINHSLPELTFLATVSSATSGEKSSRLGATALRVGDDRRTVALVSGVMYFSPVSREIYYTKVHHIKKSGNEREKLKRNHLIT